MTSREILAAAVAVAAYWLATAERPLGATPFPPDAPAKVSPAPDRPSLLPVRKPRPRTTANPATDFVASKTHVCPFDSSIEVACDLPDSLRLKNTGGIGPRGPGSGAGLCVFTSKEHCGRYQNEPRLVGFQKSMMHEPGGGDPEKLDRMMAKYCAGVDYVQHTGGDPEFLKLALKTGRMVAVTYCGVDGLPDRYGDAVIAHMVNCVYLDDKYAAILDNNFPREILWMSADNFIARWKGVKPDGSAFLGRDQRGRRFPIGGGWACLPLNPAPPPPPRN